MQTRLGLRWRRPPLPWLCPLRRFSGTLLVVLFLLPATFVGTVALRGKAESEGLSASEFSRLIRDISEPGGYFHSDNFVSNETSYLHIVGRLQELAAPGGAYIGVGPEQNFTYIAKLRPRIAFIVDIRRQAVIQHLLYKAIFHLAPSRAQFFSYLLSKPLPAAGAPVEDSSIGALLAFFEKLPADSQVFAANLAVIRKTIQEGCQFDLSPRDQESLEYVYRSFFDQGLRIAYRTGGFGGSYFPNLRDLILETDLRGELGNFLATQGDYDFVRGMQEKNLIIPVVGDFAGPKALAAVGEYLRKNDLRVAAFYTSNVERYLFEGGSFPAFVGNIRKLPINGKSLLIRSVPGGYYYSHPARLPGHRSVSLLQEMTLFVDDFDQGRYKNYKDLISTHYIAPEER